MTNKSTIRLVLKVVSIAAIGTLFWSSMKAFISFLRIMATFNVGNYDITNVAILPLFLSVVFLAIMVFLIKTDFGKTSLVFGTLTITSYFFFSARSYWILIFENIIPLQGLNSLAFRYASEKVLIAIFPQLIAIISLCSLQLSKSSKKTIPEH